MQSASPARYTPGKENPAVLAVRSAEKTMVSNNVRSPLRSVTNSPVVKDSPVQQSPAKSPMRHGPSPEKYQPRSPMNGSPDCNDIDRAASNVVAQLEARQDDLEGIEIDDINDESTAEPADAFPVVSEHVPEEAEEEEDENEEAAVTTPTATPASPASSGHVRDFSPEASVQSVSRKTVAQVPPPTPPVSQAEVRTAVSQSHDNVVSNAVMNQPTSAPVDDDDANTGGDGEDMDTSSGEPAMTLEEEVAEFQYQANQDVDLFNVDATLKDIFWSYCIRTSQLYTDLINSQHDVEAYRSEYLRIQNEGRELYKAYVSKVNKIKDMVPKYNSLRELTEEQKERIAECHKRIATHAAEASEWKQKFTSTQDQYRQDMESKLVALQGFVEAKKKNEDKISELSAQNESLQSELSAKSDRLGQVEQKLASQVWNKHTGVNTSVHMPVSSDTPSADMSEELAAKEAVIAENNSRIESLEAEKETLMSRITELEQQANTSTQMALAAAQSAADYEAVVKERDGLRKEVASLNIKVADLEGKVSAAEEKATAVPAEVARVVVDNSEEIESLKTAHDTELTTLRSQYETKLEQANKTAADAIAEAKASQLSIESTTEGAKKDAEVAAEEAAVMAEKTSQIEAKIASLEKELSEAQDAIISGKQVFDKTEASYKKDIDELVQGVSEKDAHIATLESKITSLEESIQSKESELTSINDKLSSEMKRADALADQSDIAKYQQRYADMVTENEAFSTSMKEAFSLVGDVAEIDQMYATLFATMQGNADVLDKRVEAIFAEAEKNKDEVIAMTERMDTVTEENVSLKREIAESSAAKLKLEQAVETLRGEKRKVKEELKSTYDEVQKMMTQRAEMKAIFQKVSEENAKNKVTYDAMHKDNTALKESVDALTAKNSETSAALVEMTSQYDDIQARFTAQSEEVVSLKESLVEMTGDFESVQQAYNHAVVESTVEGVISQVIAKSLEQNIVDAQEFAEQELAGVTDTFNNRQAEQEQALNAKSADYTTLESKYNDACEEVATYKQRVEQMESSMSEVQFQLDNKVKQVLDLEQAGADSNTAKEAVDTELAELKSSYDEVTQRLAALHETMNDQGFNLSELELTHKETVTELEEVTAKFDDVSSKYSKLVEEHEALSETHSSLKAEHNVQSSFHNELTNKYDDAVAELQQLKTVEAEEKAELARTTRELQEVSTAKERERAVLQERCDSLYQQLLDVKAKAKETAKTATTDYEQSLEDKEKRHQQEKDALFAELSASQAELSGLQDELATMHEKMLQVPQLESRVAAERARLAEMEIELQTAFEAQKLAEEQASAQEAQFQSELTAAREETEQLVNEMQSMIGGGAGAGGEDGGLLFEKIANSQTQQLEERIQSLEKDKADAKVYIGKYQESSENKISILASNLAKAENEVADLDDLLQHVRMSLAAMEGHLPPPLERLMQEIAPSDNNALDDTVEA